MSPLDRKAGRYDLDGDGTLSAQELEKSKEMLELELREEKANTQRRMAWTFLVAMLIVTILLVFGFVPIPLIEALSEVVSMFYLTSASVIGFYFGAAAYMSRN